jgi:hypothetical protein
VLPKRRDHPIGIGHCSGFLAKFENSRYFHAAPSWTQLPITGS